VQRHFERWNSDTHSAAGGQQWAITGIRATLLAELASREAFRQL
jgi:hypothetical protein